MSFQCESGNVHVEAKVTGEVRLALVQVRVVAMTLQVPVSVSN